MPKRTKTEEEKGFPIKVTNFINPHLFHFKLENIVGQLDIDIEQKLRQNAELCAPTGFSPEQGSMVAAYIVSWSKWVRAEIDLILKENHSLQYVVWCSDHGVPMKLPGHHLRPIPKVLEDMQPNAYVGGLARCVPIEKSLNFATMTYDTHCINDFPEYLVNNAKQMIEEAAEIYFTPCQKIGKHIFGDVSITTYSGKKKDLLHMLTKTDSVQAGEAFIAKGFEQSNTIKKQRYENHLGHLNIRNVTNIDTASRVHCSNESAMSVCSKELDDENKLVLDWSRQNKELAKEMEKELKKRFDDTLRTLDDYGYLYRSASRINSSSSIDLVSRFNSMSTISETQPLSEQQPEKVDPKLTGLTRADKAVSFTSVFPEKPKPKKQPAKKVAYIPSGFEPDLVNFHKYNQFY